MSPHLIPHKPSIKRADGEDGFNNEAEEDKQFVQQSAAEQLGSLPAQVPREGFAEEVEEMPEDRGEANELSKGCASL